MLPGWTALLALPSVGVALAFLGCRPVLARLAARNIGRRKGRVLIVVAGLLVGTAIIASSLVVGDTLSYIFVGDVYERLDAIDEIVVDEFNGNLLSFLEAVADGIGAGLEARGSPVDGVAPVLLKAMPVRNADGNAGSQQVTVMGLNASREGAFGDFVARDGRRLSTAGLGPLEVLANERAAAQLNATAGQVLTLFYGTTNETIVYASLRDVVRDEGKAAYERRALLFMDLAAAQGAFNESGRINLVKVSNAGGVADGAAWSPDVAYDLRLVLLENGWDLRVDPVKADGIADATRFGAEATELFLVMGAFSIIAGVLLIVNIFVMLAEERKPEMGIARAVGFLRRDLLWSFTLEGTFYVALAAALGALAGLGLGYVMVLVFDRVVPHGEVRVMFHFEPGSVLLAFVAGAALTWLTVLVASWRASRLNIVRAIRDLPEPALPHGSRPILAAAAGSVAAGLGLSAWGVVANTGYGLIPGPPVVGFGLAFLATWAGRPRIGFSAAAAFALAWILAPFALLNEATDNVSVAFVMTGVILVASAILLAVFNVSEVLRAVLPHLEAGAGRPVLRTAVSYPVEKRFRTGMTVAMFALILFMVTLISMVQAMQESSLEGFVAQQSGGYDVIAYTTTYGEVPDFRRILWENLSASSFRGGEGGVSAASVMPAKVQEIGQNGSFDYTLWGVDNFLVESNEYGFYAHLPSVVDDNGTPRALSTREDVWRSLAWNRSLAIVDRSASGPNQFVPDADRLRVAPGDRIRVFDVAGRDVDLTVVGVLEQALQFTSGVFVDGSVVTGTFPAEERYTAYFFQVAPGVDVRALRADLERVFFPYGLQTIDIREEIGVAFDASQRVLTLMQAYLGIGLLVGIAGLAVVTLRAVVERRQQIGALRAIGFTKRMVLAVFLLEIALVAVLGVSIGVGLGIVFAWKVHSVYFADIVVFTVPWANLAGIVGLASAAAVASTAQPAVRASRIPPAEALRFIE
jgi:putative ABC transport system permease protein